MNRYNSQTTQIENSLRIMFFMAIIFSVIGSCGPPPQTGRYLEQNWTSDTQRHFYGMAQGSEIMPYPWILALKSADGSSQFLDEKNIRRYRYLPRKKTVHNPDGLPVGWTNGDGTHGTSGKKWFGFNCAACHTTQLEYTNPATNKTTTMRIDGAPALADFNLMSTEMVAALGRLLSSDNDAEFKQFAETVLGRDDSEKARNLLKKKVKKTHASLHKRNVINKRGSAAEENSESATDYGFGRIDAIGFIFNQVMSTLPAMSENAKPSSAQ